MKSRAIIGDVHGCYKTLLALVGKLPKNIPITLVGDLVDRGPDSLNVIKWVIDNNIDCVMGNHEEFMVNYRNQTYGCDIWLHPNNGGIKTWLNYILPRNDAIGRDETLIPDYEKHIDFLETLPILLKYDDCLDNNDRKLLVTHSSAFEVGESLDQTDSYFLKNHLLWSRNWLEYKKDEIDIPGIFNVFGHTPLKEPIVTNTFANIDTGACYGKKLTALIYPEMDIIQQQNLDIKR